MRLHVDISQVTFLVTKNPEPKTDQDGKQRYSKRDGNAPMWATQVVAQDAEGAEVFSVTVAGEKPNVTVGERVTPIGLEAMPWNNNGRNGVAFRALELKPVSAVRKAA